MKKKKISAKLIKEITFSPNIDVKKWFDSVKDDILKKYKNHHIIINNEKLIIIKFKKTKFEYNLLLDAMLCEIEFEKDINVKEWFLNGGKDFIERDYPSSHTVHIFSNSVMIMKKSVFNFENRYNLNE